MVKVRESGSPRRSSGDRAVGDLLAQQVLRRSRARHRRAPPGRRPAGDLLAQVAGTWAGYLGDDYTRTLADALVEIPGAAEWGALGKKRRGLPPRRTP